MIEIKTENTTASITKKYIQYSVQTILEIKKINK